jgi:glycosyltransferase involved in cell wall biosynthesis
VLLLVDRLGRGGTAQVVLNTALGLDRERFLPIVCTTRRAPAAGQDDVLRRAGVPLISLDRASRADLSAWKPLRELLPRVSILHAHETGSNLWGRLWGRVHRVPIVITQDHTPADSKGRLKHVVDRALVPLSDRLVVVSDHDRDLAIRHEKLPPEKVSVIHSGIDVEQFADPLGRSEAGRPAGLPASRHVLAVVGRLVPQKNQASLLRALALLPSQLRAETHTVFIGDGHLEGELRLLAEDLGVRDSVSFLGPRQDVGEILRAIDLLVLPSNSECLPIVLLEALAAGCPIVATSVGGVPEILGELSWPQVPPDDPSALADGIRRVLTMPEAERASLTEVGRETVRAEFSREAFSARVESLYDSLLSSTPSSS